MKISHLTHKYKTAKDCVTVLDSFIHVSSPLSAARHSLSVDQPFYVLRRAYINARLKGERLVQC